MPTVLPFEEVVTRWVTNPRPLEQVVRDPAALDVGGVQLLAFRHDDATWTASGRLRGPRTKIELQITSWPAGRTEVTLRPAGRRLLSWTPRKERRYFDAAHDVASRVAGALTSVA